MRILMISDHADPLALIGSRESGGQNVYVMNIASRLVARGHHVDVYTRWDSPSKQEVVQVKSRLRVIRVSAGPCDYMPRDNFLDVTGDFITEVKARIERESLIYDAIFSNYWFSGIIGMELAEAYGIPQTHVYHSIGKIRYETLKKIQPQEVDHKLFHIRNMWERRIAHKATSIITTSPVEQNDIKRIFGVDGGRIVCIPIGVDMRMFRPRPIKILRTKLGLPLTKPIILYVGRIEWRKGIGTLIRSLSKVPKAELYIVGGGLTKSARQLDAVERKRLDVIVKDLGLSKRVHFLGAKTQAQVAQYYAAADVCAVPSYYEPFGIVPIEAMACGTPVVASQTGGMKFTVSEGLTGHLALPNNYMDLATKLNTVIERGRSVYSEAARNHVRQYFSWPKIAIDTAAHLAALPGLMKEIVYEDSASRSSRGVGAAESLWGDRASSLQSL